MVAIIIKQLYKYTQIIVRRWLYGFGKGRREALMECEICADKCDRTVIVFIKGIDQRKLCNACVLRLRTRSLEYSEKRQKYYFKKNLKKNRLLNGRM
jgi:MinD superfamily P-loop ATPase